MGKEGEMSAEEALKLFRETGCIFVKYPGPWNSVNERVPENALAVIIGGECCEICYNIDIGFYEDGEWYLENGNDLKFPVTHWMPLPPPPPKS